MRYHLRETFARRLQGIVLLTLAYATHKTNADEAMLIFGLMGISLLSLDLSFIPRYIYIMARKIVRYGNRKEWYMK